MRRLSQLGGVILIASLASTYCLGQLNYKVPGGTVVVPASSIAHPGDAGHRAHTNFEIFISDAWHNFGVPPPNAETPASLACVYGLVKPVTGCPISGTHTNPSGGSGVIAIVDAYDNPNAETDLSQYSKQFGLPDCSKANGCFQQVYATGQQPTNDPGGWSLEEALDIEMAHAMAPQAKIVLVEAASNENSDLYFAEDVASQIVANAGGGQITNSWGEDEYQGETDDDVHFKTSSVVYIASTGDSGAPGGYPSMSPYLVAAGGTTIVRTNGNITDEQGWSGAGGGKSVYEKRPSWQDRIKNVVGNARGIPDFSFDANPASGPAMYDLDGGYLWLQIGGTSVASPALAGVVNAAGHHAKSTNGELTAVYHYAPAHYKAAWRDETVGNNGFGCTKGWDFVTGIGSPKTYAGK